MTASTQPAIETIRQRAEEALNDDAIMVPIVELTALARDALALIAALSAVEAEVVILKESLAQYDRGWKAAEARGEALREAVEAREEFVTALNADVEAAEAALGTCEYALLTGGEDARREALEQCRALLLTPVSPSEPGTAGCPYGCSSNDNVNTPCPHCDSEPGTQQAEEER